jgi:hypothetical protein
MRVACHKHSEELHAFQQLFQLGREAAVPRLSDIILFRFLSLGALDAFFVWGLGQYRLFRPDVGGYRSCPDQLVRSLGSCGNLMRSAARDSTDALYQYTVKKIGSLPPKGAIKPSQEDQLTVGCSCYLGVSSSNELRFTPSSFTGCSSKSTLVMSIPRGLVRFEYLL